MAWWNQRAPAAHSLKQKHPKGKPKNHWFFPYFLPYNYTFLFGKLGKLNKVKVRNPGNREVGSCWAEVRDGVLLLFVTVCGWSHGVQGQFTWTSRATFQPPFLNGISSWISHLNLYDFKIIWKLWLIILCSFFIFYFLCIVYFFYF